MRTVVYTLEEFLVQWPEPPGLTGEGFPPGAQGMVVAVVDEEQHLRAYWPIWTAVHVDGLWIDQGLTAETGAGAVRGLLLGLFATLRESGVARAFAVLPPGTPSLEQGERLGFQRQPGDLYLLQVPPEG